MDEHFPPHCVPCCVRFLSRNLTLQLDGSVPLLFRSNFTFSFTICLVTFLVILHFPPKTPMICYYIEDDKWKILITDSSAVMTTFMYYSQNYFLALLRLLIYCLSLFLYTFLSVMTSDFCQ